MLVDACHEGLDPLLLSNKARTQGFPAHFGQPEEADAASPVTLSRPVGMTPFLVGSRAAQMPEASTPTGYGYTRRRVDEETTRSFTGTPTLQRHSSEQTRAAAIPAMRSSCKNAAKSGSSRPRCREEMGAASALRGEKSLCRALKGQKRIFRPCSFLNLMQSKRPLLIDSC